jgi:hypothetical protein
VAGVDHLVCAHVFPFLLSLFSNTDNSYIICIAASATLYLVLATANKKKAAVPEDETERAKLAFQDLTDMENPYFRYVL